MDIKKGQAKEQKDGLSSTLLGRLSVGHFNPFLNDLGKGLYLEIGISNAKHDAGQFLIGSISLKKKINFAAQEHFLKCQFGREGKSLMQIFLLPTSIAGKVK